MAPPERNSAVARSKISIDVRRGPSAETPPTMMTLPSWRVALWPQRAALREPAGTKAAERSAALASSGASGAKISVLARMTSSRASGGPLTVVPPMISARPLGRRVAEWRKRGRGHGGEDGEGGAVGVVEDGVGEGRESQVLGVLGEAAR